MNTGSLMSEGFTSIGQLGDFPVGSKKRVHVNSDDVFVTNIAGGIHAIADACTHRGCSLSKGTIEGTVVVCPCHGGRFDLATGKVVAPPPRIDEASFDVRVQGSDVLIKKR
jgi:3-phenylpropionate/trans-cinnamate dioxygenase ferredoxin subunit